MAGVVSTTGLPWRATQARHRSFANHPDRGDLVAYPAQRVVRHDGAYTWHRAGLSEEHALRAVGGVMQITTPAGERLQFEYERYVEHPSGDWTWVGRAKDGAASEEVILTFGEHAAFGSISQPGQAPLKLTMSGGVSWLIETDRSQIAGIDNSATRPRKPDFLVPPKIKAGGGASAESSPAAAAAVSAPAAATTTVDVLLGYTSGFAAAQGGPSQAVTRLNNMVEITNQAYANSQVDARVRLVHAMQVSYPDNTSNDSTLEALTGFRAPSTRTTPDAAFAALRSARDQYGADLVSLVRQFNTPENDGCGIAWLIGGGQSGINSSDEYFGYSVVSDGRDAGSDGKTYFCREETLAHELGHNMGSQHDRIAATVDGSLKYGLYPYSFGQKTTADAGNFYTVMAYGDSGQISYRTFSNPRTTYCGGLPCGVAEQSDNARSLALSMPIAASFRNQVVPSGSRTPDDINGDGKSDIIWRQLAQNQIAFWMMNGSIVTDYRLGAGQSGHKIISTGDFNGDNRIDLLWDNGGTLNLWTSTGTEFSSSLVASYGDGWKPATVADVNGDGNVDIIWIQPDRNQIAYWLMNGSAVIGQGFQAALSGYTIIGAGDFNGDSRFDLLWDNGGTLYLWTSTATGFDSALVASYGDGWKPEAVADVSGDGKMDIIWRQLNQNQIAYWIMNGASVTGFGSQTGLAGFSIISTGDFNGDGRFDLLWDNGGTLYTWSSTGSGFSSALVASYGDGWTPWINALKR